MTKITADHLARSACVYVRQSTADQLVHNHESRRRQYGLADRARQLGWAAVEVIDDDLGRSGGGINRPGFERLLAAICESPNSPSSKALVRCMSGCVTKASYCHCPQGKIRKAEPASRSDSAAIAKLGNRFF